MNPRPTSSHPDNDRDDSARPLRVLRVDASGRGDDSATRRLTASFVRELAARQPIELVELDLGAGLPFVDAAWIAANFTDPDARDAGQRATLAGSDALVAEVMAADALVIGVPLYNFGVPATLKAWIDQIARARVTFRYTADGPEGLLRGKRAWLLVASGGTPVGGAVDFATPWLRHVLGFLGIGQVEVIAAERLNADAGGLERAQARIVETLSGWAPVAEAA